MKENFNILRKKFIYIKNLGLIKSLRNGPTGLGYTFETLLDKKEDSFSLPDFNGIEIKTKLGYSKSPMTLFNLVPKRKNESAIKYILDNYSWKNKTNNTSIFSSELYSTQYVSKNNFNFKIFVNYIETKIVIKSYKNNMFYENVCYWDFRDLERTLKRKLTYLAIIFGYPYKKYGVLHYKYLKMNTYKLKGFFEFLKLIENDKIIIKFYVKRNLDQKIENHGISFRINNDHIEELFTKLYY